MSDEQSERASHRSAAIHVAVDAKGAPARLRSRRAHCRKEERGAILEHLHSERFVDRAPAEVVQLGFVEQVVLVADPALAGEFFVRLSRARSKNSRLIWCFNKVDQYQLLWKRDR
jgi:hypothetical protein